MSRRQIAQQRRRYLSNDVNRLLKRFFGVFRRNADPAHFSDVLARCRLNLFFGSRWIESAKGGYVSTHAKTVEPGIAAKSGELGQFEAKEYIY